MKATLSVGIRIRSEILTTPAMAPPHLGETDQVLSTPSMIGLMENACHQATAAHLDGSEQTVGTMVHIWHRAAVRIGETVICEAELIEMERRRLLFKVRVRFGEKTIGEGTHERFVIDMSRFKGS